MILFTSPGKLRNIGASAACRWATWDERARRLTANATESLRKSTFALATRFCMNASVFEVDHFRCLPSQATSGSSRRHSDHRTQTRRRSSSFGFRSRNQSTTRRSALDFSLRVCALTNSGFVPFAHLAEHSKLKRRCIPRSVEVLDKYGFSNLKVDVLTFESESRSTRIEEECFRQCSLKSTCVPRSVEILGKSCFAGSKVEVLTLESESRLT